MMFKIGNIGFKNNVVVAPMAGITNSSYRKILKKMGASLIYAEMVSDKALVYNSKKTFDLLKMDDIERPIAQQIFGSEPDDFVKAAVIIEEYMHPDIIDINMGCPVPKVAIKNQAGSALLKNPQKIGEIVKKVSESVSVPVTIKIRSGWDENSINAVEVAKIAEENGAKAITIHARTRSQGYTGKADWNIIKMVKESVSIPVIGNGDINTCYDAYRMIKETNCDAVMIGRGLLGNPWLIKECIEYLDNGTQPRVISDKEKLEMILEHYYLLKKDKGLKLALLEIRSHALWYVKGLNNSKDLKRKLSIISSEVELLNIIDEEIKKVNG